MCDNSEILQVCPFLANWFSTSGDIDDFIFADFEQWQICDIDTIEPK